MPSEVLIIAQLQRHARGTLRSLWQIRPRPVRRHHQGLVRLFAFALLIGRSQIRQGIANNTKGTAFVVYEDVMDAKSACDKLNGFNFQNRYLVGMKDGSVGDCQTNLCSTVSPAREDAEGSERSRRAPGELRKAQETARYRLA
jgi:RNA recognition motif-containing protein